MIWLPFWLSKPTSAINFYSSQPVFISTIKSKNLPCQILCQFKWFGCQTVLNTLKEAWFSMKYRKKGLCFVLLMDAVLIILGILTLFYNKSLAGHVIVASFVCLHFL